MIMTDAEFDLLRSLLETPSPSGFEQPVQRIWRKFLAEVADEISGDVMGNAAALISGSGEKGLRVMLAAHCDEIGFMIRYIDEAGFLYFAPIGGVDAHLVPGQRILVHTAAGAVPGVVGKKPIHLMETKDRETVVKFKNQFVDIGCSDRKQAEALVSVGDPITFAAGVERLEGGRVTARSFDDKVGIFIVARVLEEVKRRGLLPVDLIGVSTVQEEVGLRGGGTSAYWVRPDLAIVVEAGFATDFPEIDRKETGDFRLGGGPILSRGANIHPRLFDLLLETARRNNIPVQILGEPRATGTDANVIQLVRSGVATALVRVPLRYMHTPAEVLDLGDVDHAIHLLTEFLFRLDGRCSFIQV